MSPGVQSSLAIVQTFARQISGVVDSNLAQAVIAVFIRNGVDKLPALCQLFKTSFDAVNHPCGGLTSVSHPRSVRMKVPDSWFPATDSTVPRLSDEVSPPSA